MAISDYERARIKHHLRFPEVFTVSGFMAGSPTTVEDLYGIDGSINNIRPEAESIVRDQISMCDTAENQLNSMGCHLSVGKVGNITMREDELKQRREFYDYQCKRLADSLGADLNPMGATGSNRRNINRNMS